METVEQRVDRRSTHGGRQIFTIDQTMNLVSLEKSFLRYRNSHEGVLGPV